MHKKFNQSLFIFRRDLRLSDNTGLIAALNQSQSVIPCFIFDPVQIGPQNSYRSNNAVQFMLESLEDLDKDLRKRKGKLYYFHGDPGAVVKKIINECAIDAVFCNRDYTPFSRHRDSAIEEICRKAGVDFFSFSDALLTDPSQVLTSTQTPYKVYTAFYKAAQKIPIDLPQENRFTNFSIDSIASEWKFNDKEILSSINRNIFEHGGRNSALKILKNVAELKNYQKTRDIPSLLTSGLSAHNKFGTASIREVYYAIVEHLGANHPLLRQLYWRDFFSHVGFHYPTVFGHAFRTKYDDIRWSHDKALFEKWCRGATGFPIVDAGMRQLNTTGFMHNRVRMIVGSFLTKDLYIDWRWGEKYFAQQLVDYDPLVNNGNWQWVASTGCDAQPYFRIFNPWLQQKKFDHDCRYIKQWIPELKDTPNSTIHTWFNQKKSINGYPLPLVDHKKASHHFKKFFIGL